MINLENLREIRKKNNLSLKKLGEMIGMAESTVSLYENGKREPDNETLIKLSKVLNCSIDYLLGNTDDPRPIDKQLAGIDLALYGDKNNNPDNSIVIFNRNGEITKKKFSEEQMKYLKKFISSLTDEDYPDL